MLANPPEIITNATSAVQIQKATLLALLTLISVSSFGPLSGELLCVLGVQSLPAAELHRFATNDAADGSSAEKTIQHIETDVVPRGTHRYQAASVVGPQRQACPAAEGFE